MIAALLLGIALGAAAALLVTARATDASRRRVTARSSSPDKSRIAVAFEAPCADGLCQELRLGASQDASTVLSSLTNRSCAEIAWTPDGTRVAFLIDGSEIAIYDAQTSKLAGTVRLLTSEATPDPRRTWHHVLGERPRCDFRRLSARAFRLPGGRRGGAAVRL